MLARLVPITLLLLLPWVLQRASGRAFSFEAVFFAMLGVTVDLAIVGGILAASVLARLAWLVRIGLWRGPVAAGAKP